MGEELVDSSPKTHLEIFNEAFPMYLAIGMTYSQFWHEDCTLVVHYRKAHKIKQKSEDERLWLQGKYYYDALCMASPLLRAFGKRGTKAHPYHKHPIGMAKPKLEGKSLIESERAKAAEYFSSLAREWKRKHNREELARDVRPD